VNIVVADVIETALLRIASNPMANSAKAKQGLDINLDNVVPSLPLVSANGNLGSNSLRRPKLSRPSPSEGGDS
jgi:hypothetical protein